MFLCSGGIVVVYVSVTVLFVSIGDLVVLITDEVEDVDVELSVTIYVVVGFSAVFSKIL